MGRESIRFASASSMNFSASGFHRSVAQLHRDVADVAHRGRAVGLFIGARGVLRRDRMHSGNCHGDR